ncbi:hypothetical protein Cadr_000017453 [Camelus dromedarius]|uniref:Uncharacterized protein n=1 Tax=Camelus dromedarius TaxID=9838 RepID=A0A5N4DEH2_CAMDR|nr:hypothetical protein Cadr_000017453 [Camelus dromedarius]
MGVETEAGGGRPLSWSLQGLIRGWAVLLISSPSFLCFLPRIFPSQVSAIAGSGTQDCHGLTLIYYSVQPSSAHLTEPREVRRSLQAHLYLGSSLEESRDRMGTGQAVGRTDKRPRGHPVAGDGGGHSHESVSERGRNSSTAPAPQDDGQGRQTRILSGCPCPPLTGWTLISCSNEPWDRLCERKRMLLAPFVVFISSTVAIPCWACCTGPGGTRTGAGCHPPPDRNQQELNGQPVEGARRRIGKGWKQAS